MSAFAYQLWYSNGIDSYPATYHINSSFMSASKTAMELAIYEWNVHSGPLLFTIGSDTTTTTPNVHNEKNEITKGDRGNASSTYLMATFATHTSFLFSEIYEADIDVNTNSSCPWANNGNNDVFDIQAVMTHEFGHALGLYHSRNRPSNSWQPSGCDYETMISGTVIGEIFKRTIQTDDVNGMDAIYSY